MLQYTVPASSLNTSRQSNPTSSLACFDEICKLEMEEGLARIQRQLDRERRKENLRFLGGLWPLAVGLALACLAPLASELLAPSTSLGMAIVFPFVVLTQRPELHLTGTMAAMLPQFMLYAQFPIEGLLARSATKGHVTLPAVVMRVASLHLLAGALLLLISGIIG